MALVRARIPIFLAALLVLDGCAGSTSIKSRARQITDQAAEIEPSVTPTVVALAEGEGGRMIKLEERLKTRKSTRRKLRKLRKSNPDIPIWRLELEDSLRYTIQLKDKPPGWHTAAINRILRALEADGHEVLLVKNYWPRGDSYSGVNSVLEHQSGLKWELQFHTARSVATQKKTRDWYEELRDEDTTIERKRKLFKKMTKAWDKVPIPVDILLPQSLHQREEIIHRKGP